MRPAPTPAWLAKVTVLIRTATSRGSDGDLPFFDPLPPPQPLFLLMKVDRTQLAGQGEEVDGRLRPTLGRDLLGCGPHPLSILMGKPDQDLSHLDNSLGGGFCLQEVGGLFWQVQEPEEVSPPPDLQSGQLAQPPGHRIHSWPHRGGRPQPWKPAEQALAWGSPTYRHHWKCPAWPESSRV